MINRLLSAAFGPESKKKIKTTGIVGLLLMFLCTTHVYAEPSYVQSKRLTLNMKNISMKDVLHEIESNSEYIFFYSDEVNVSRQVVVTANNQTIDEIMGQLLDNTGYTYNVSDRQVFIKKVAAPRVAERSAVKQSVVTGTVLDPLGDPIIGANVVLKGNESVGTITDIDGNFSLNVPANAVLKITYIGYKVQEVVVKKGTPLRIIMQEDSEVMDEVVITAFGAGQKKESIVGAIQTVRPNDLVVPGTNLSTSFAGRLAGVVSFQRSGQPGDNTAEFYIRGVSTMSGITSPLIILDGVEVDKSVLDALDPEVIDGFSILKDATASAMYGTRGANGVMIIKTKSGANTERPIISVRAETYVSTPTRIPKFVDGANYMELYNEAVMNQQSGNTLYSQEQIFNTRKGTNPHLFPNVDWYGEIFNNLSFNQKANFNIRGGTSKITYFMNVGVNHESGMLKNKAKDYFSYNNNINLMKYTFQNNIDFHMTKSSTVSLHLNVQLDDLKSPNAGVNGIYNSIMNVNPVDFPIAYPGDDVNWVKWGALASGNNQGASNPMAELTKGYNNQFESSVMATLDFEQKLDMITKGLKFKALVSFKNYSKTITKRAQGYNKYAVSSYTLNPDGTYSYDLNPVNSPTKPLLKTESEEGGNRRVYGQAYLDYTRSFGLHHVNAMALWNADQYNMNVPKEEKLDEVVVNSLLMNSLPRRKMGYAGRLSYNYDHRYLLELNAGYNGSENFADGHRWGFFPSVAVGWNVSQEKFFAPLTKVVNNLKLRASYGLVGNDQIIDNNILVRFIYLAQIDLEGSEKFQTGYGDSTSERQGPVYSRYQNNKVTWEVGEKLNVGLDLQLFNSLNINIDAFREIRRDIFQRRYSIPNYLGTAKTDVFGNLAKVKNWGIEASADYGKRITKDLTVLFKGTFTFARNKVLEYDEAPGLRVGRSQIGKKLKTHQGYISNGLYIDWADIAHNPASALGNIAIAPGDIKYVDQPDANGYYDGKITSDDQVYMGHPTVPEIVYGFGPSIQWKNWDFSFFFQGVANTSLMMSDFHPFGTQYNRNVLKFVADDYWSETNQNPNAQYPRLTKDNNNHNTANSTFWLRNASFLKLKNAEVGYSPFHNMRIYLSGTNLLTFSPFKHWDPEMGGGKGLSYPTQRIFNFGIQMTFK